MRRAEFVVQRVDEAVDKVGGTADSSFKVGSGPGRANLFERFPFSNGLPNAVTNSGGHIAVEDERRTVGHGAMTGHNLCSGSGVGDENVERLHKTQDRSAIRDRGGGESLRPENVSRHQDITFDKFHGRVAVRVCRSKRNHLNGLAVKIYR
jgi:hypothetical protein